MKIQNAKTQRSIFFLCIIFLAKSVFALPFDMILTGDPILEDIRFLSIESGTTFLSFTPPLAPAEVENFLDSIDPSVLSIPAQEAYQRIQNRLIPQSRLSFASDNFSALLNINSTVEGRVRFNRDLDWHPRHPNIAPMISLPARFFFANTVQLYLEPFVAVSIPHYEKAGTFGTNLHYNVEGDLDPTMPHRAFLAAGGSWWNFQIGRDHLFWGTGHTGSFSFSGNASYFEYARLSLFSGRFKYSLVINQMPLRLTHDMAYGGDRSRTTQRHFYLHRLDFIFRDSLSIGIMEGRMVGNSPLNLRYIIPLAMFNSSEEDMTSSFFSIEANWNIFRSFSVYGQFVMNDFAALSDNSSQSPSGLGFMAGLNFARSFNSWGSVFFLEYIYTHPYLYMSSSPFSSFIQRNRVDVTGTRYYFIGFPRDTITLTLGARFFRGSALSLTGELSWLSRGEYAADNVMWNWTSSASNQRNLSGIPENNYIAAFSAMWQPLSRFSFNGNITGIFSRGNNNIPGSNITGGQMSFSVIFQY